MSETKKHLIITERPGSILEFITANGYPAIIATDGKQNAMVHFDPADAPAIALAVLEAAGVNAHYVSSYHTGSPEALSHAAEILREFIARAEAHAAAAAEEAAMGKRRDELVREFSEFPSTTYASLGSFTQRTIDRIIELEERAK